MKFSNENEKWNDVYLYVVSVYMDKISIKDAAEKIHNIHYNVAQNSFIMYYYAYKKMLSGELHTRSISQSLRKLFLDRIYENFGVMGLRKALKAYLAHIEFRKKNGDNPIKDKILYEEYANKI